MAERPNILLILQDQLRYDAVADPQLCRTPALDRLRSQGVSFSRYYTPTALCSPARSAILTGLYPHGTGITRNVSGPDADLANLPHDVPTVAETLAAAGYRTGYVGKWHLGVDDGPRDRGFADTRESDPELWGNAAERFRDFWSVAQPGSPYVVNASIHSRDPRVAARWPFDGAPMYATCAVEPESTTAHAVCESACDLLRTHATGEEPFFIVASFLEPHWPNILPEPWFSMYQAEDMVPWPNYADSYEGKPGVNRAMADLGGGRGFTWDDWSKVVAFYLGAVSYLDALTGRIIDTLDSLGMAESTLVVVSTDHGDMTGSHGHFNKGVAMYEEIYHIPCIARLPGRIPAGAVSDAFGSHVDLTPTFLDVANVSDPPPSRGRSFMDLFRDGAPPWRDSLLCESYGLELGPYSQRMIRRGDYKLIFNHYDLRELYDLATDPHELHNLAYLPEHASIRRDLEVEMLLMMAECGDPLTGASSIVLG